MKKIKIEHFHLKIIFSRFMISKILFQKFQKEKCLV